MFEYMSYLQICILGESYVDVFMVIGPEGGGGALK